MFDLVVSRRGEEVVSIPIDKDNFRLGRAPTNDLTIPDSSVSRNQCEIIRSQGSLHLIDQSGKGTRVNNKLCYKVQLNPNDQLEFGSLCVFIRETDHGPCPGITLSGGKTDVMPKNTTSAEELVIRGEVKGKPLFLPLNSPVLTIGADLTCDLTIDDPFVSSFHCRIYKKKGAWFVFDLDSTNGTFVNGVQVGDALLSRGSYLQLGNVRLDVESRFTASENLNKFGMVSVDANMYGVFDLIHCTAPTNETVLITGETGTGKELVARALHKFSPRSTKLFLPINCATITSELLESELFGHEKGAFTGAIAKHKGLFEYAHQGTLFLDEIGELSLNLQAKLLRVMESGEVRAIGSNLPKQVDTRIIAATHQPLCALVKEGKFREDLYYRINVIEIALPPLRERKDDILVLADYFLAQLASKRVRHCTLSPDARESLVRYNFPGNVRELKNIITRALILCPSETIDAKYITFSPPTLADRVAEGKLYYRGKTLREIEVRVIHEALIACDFNQKKTASMLGIARSTLIQKIQKYNIHPADTQK